MNLETRNKNIQRLAKGADSDWHICQGFFLNTSIRKIAFITFLLYLVLNISAQVKRQYDYKADISHWKEYSMGIVVKDGKCGYVDRNGTEVIPLIYDYEEGPLHTDNGLFGYDHLWNENNTVLIRVKKNNKYGYINKENKIVIPIIYDQTGGLSFSRNILIKVKHSGKYGYIDRKGDAIIPIIYDDASNGYIYKSSESVTCVKRDGKYAFINGEGKFLTDFKFDTAESYWGFGITEKELAPVSINGKYGYVNKSGELEIPFKYDKASIFGDNLAPVVKDNKLGFIDTNGNVVIPFIYDNIGSNNYHNDGIAVVRKNGKWGIIDIHGNVLAPFKYDYCIGHSSIGNNNMICNRDTVYLDIMGHEYATKQDRSNASNKSMLEAAEAGNPHAQWYVSWNYNDGRDYPKDLKESYNWCVKAANAGEVSAMHELGKKYYYGDGCEEDLSKAFKWFSKAAKAGMINSQFFLGWMLEHGQGTNKDIVLGIEWYKKAALHGYERAITQLKKNNISIDDLFAAPNPTPINTLATMLWHVSEATTMQKNYSFKISINSNSKIEEVNVHVNGILTRGSAPIQGDGYNMTIDRAVALNEGQNTIKVTVKNAGGTATSEKIVTYTLSKSTPIIQHKRIALVIGNANYASQRLESLNSPLKDAKDVRDKLKKLGFEVRPIVENGSKNTMRKAIKDFIKEAKNYDVALFFYSGHGIQSKPGINATNYLIPSDAKLLYSESLPGECIDLNEMVLNNLSKGREGKASLVFIDACRTVLNLPSESDFGDTKGSDRELRGLNEQASPEGVCVVYATRAGSVSYDMRQKTEITGQNSLNSYFTQGLLECLDEEKDKNLPMFIQRLKDKVRAKTKGKQVPSPYNELYGDFYFDPTK